MEPRLPAARAHPHTVFMLLPSAFAQLRRARVRLPQLPATCTEAPDSCPEPKGTCSEPGNSCTKAVPQDANSSIPSRRDLKRDGLPLNFRKRVFKRTVMVRNQALRMNPGSTVTVGTAYGGGHPILRLPRIRGITPFARQGQRDSFYQGRTFPLPPRAALSILPTRIARIRTLNHV